MSGRVVHVKDNVEGAVYIGRRNNGRGLKQSLFANPFPVGMFSRAVALRMFRQYLMSDEFGRAVLEHVPKLRGKPLACWCRHDGEERTEANACHGDVLLELLDRHTDEELRAMGRGGQL